MLGLPATSAWWEVDGIEPLARRDRVYSAATAPACPYGTSQRKAVHGRLFANERPFTAVFSHTGCGPRGCTGPSRRMRPRGFLTDLPAQMMRGFQLPRLLSVLPR